MLLLGLELVFLALPVTLVDGFGLVMLSVPNGHPDYLPMLTGVLLATVSLVGFWRLAFGFMLGEPRSIHDAPTWARWSAGSGAALCLAALLLAMLFDRLNGWALVGLLGLPVTVPLGHMLAMSTRRSAV
ncbi:hypothetical protein ACIGHF_07450 [Stenotrophomonas sp. NPDC077464]|uniref:hypothetical protein n=1 Tax=unclassified Stenotrophomonas TaxID=196198 RepID=UPI0037CD822E